MLKTVNLSLSRRVEVLQPSLGVEFARILSKVVDIYQFLAKITSGQHAGIPTVIASLRVDQDHGFGGNYGPVPIDLSNCLPR